MDRRPLPRRDRGDRPDGMIAPTLGVQHFFSKQFSIGIDAALQYGQTNQNDRDDFATQTRVLLRAFF